MKEVQGEEKVLIDYLSTRLDRLSCCLDPKRELEDICYKLKQFQKLKLLSAPTYIELYSRVWSVALEHCIEEFIPEYYQTISKVSGGGRS